MEESISKDNIEVMVIPSETRKIVNKTAAQLEAVLATLS